MCRSRRLDSIFIYTLCLLRVLYFVEDNVFYEMAIFCSILNVIKYKTVLHFKS